MSLTSLIDFFTTFIATPSITKNPHLRAKVVEVLSLLSPKRLKFRLSPDPFLSGVSSRELGGSLIRFFVDFERTGGLYGLSDVINSSSQYSVLRQIQCPLFRCIHSPTYLEITSLQSLFQSSYLVTYAVARLYLFSRDTKTDYPLRYANMVMNDIVYLLDEAFQGIEKFRKHEDDVKLGVWDRLPPGSQQDAVTELSQTKRTVIVAPVLTKRR